MSESFAERARRQRQKFLAQARLSSPASGTKPASLDATVTSKEAASSPSHSPFSFFSPRPILHLGLPLNNNPSDGQTGASSFQPQSQGSSRNAALDGGSSHNDSSGPTEEPANSPLAFAQALLSPIMGTFDRTSAFSGPTADSQGISSAPGPTSDFPSPGATGAAWRQGSMTRGWRTSRDPEKEAGEGSISRGGGDGAAMRHTQTVEAPHARLAGEGRGGEGAEKGSDRGSDGGLDGESDSLSRGGGRAADDATMDPTATAASSSTDSMADRARLQRLKFLLSVQAKKKGRLGAAKSKLPLSAVMAASASVSAAPTGAGDVDNPCSVAEGVASDVGMSVHTASTEPVMSVQVGTMTGEDLIRRVSQGRASAQVCVEEDFEQQGEEDEQDVAVERVSLVGQRVLQALVMGEPLGGQAAKAKRRSLDGRTLHSEGEKLSIPLDDEEEGEGGEEDEEARAGIRVGGQQAGQRAERKLHRRQSDSYLERAHHEEKRELEGRGLRDSLPAGCPMRPLMWLLRLLTCLMMRTSHQSLRPTAPPPPPRSTPWAAHLTREQQHTRAVAGHSFCLATTHW